MKYCPSCHKEFAPQFSFCPLDGLPLVAAEHGDARAAFVEARSDEQGSDAQTRGEYHLTILAEAGLVARLLTEVRAVALESQLTWPEFKRDPFGFTKRTFVGYGQMFLKFLRKPNVLVAMGAAFLAMLALVGAVMMIDRSQSSGSSRVGLVVFAIIACSLLVALFSTWLGRERGAAVMGAEPSDSRSVVAAIAAPLAAAASSWIRATAFSIASIRGSNFA